MARGGADDGACADDLLLAGFRLGSCKLEQHPDGWMEDDVSDLGVGASSDAGSSRNDGADAAVDLPAIVGRNLRRVRTRQGYSLERLAKQSGVSRAMLGQIETGKSIPTIGLLWKVATALNIPFAHLLGTQEARGTVLMRQKDAKILTSNQGQFTSRALFPFDDDHKVEFYELRIAPLHREEAEAHTPGTRENLFVAKGVVEITAGTARPVTVTEGDAILFDADVPHIYKNLVTSEAVIYLVMTYIEGTG